MLRIPINSVHDQYVSNFNLTKKWTKKITATSQTTAGIQSAREGVAVGRDNKPDPDE